VHSLRWGACANFLGEVIALLDSRHLAQDGQRGLAGDAAAHRQPAENRQRRRGDESDR